MQRDGGLRPSHGLASLCPCGLSAGCSSRSCPRHSLCCCFRHPIREAAQTCTGHQKTPYHQRQAETSRWGKDCRVIFSKNVEGTWPACPSLIRCKRSNKLKNHSNTLNDLEPKCMYACDESSFLASSVISLTAGTSISIACMPPKHNGLLHQRRCH